MTTSNSEHKKKQSFDMTIRLLTVRTARSVGHRTEAGMTEL